MALSLLPLPKQERTPFVRLGVDLCAHCGMIVAEVRYSAVMFRGGMRIAFDDVGCMLAYMNETGSFDAEAYVHTGTGFVEARSAWYVVADVHRLWTPMSTGILATGSREEAEALAARYGGRFMNWTSLVEMYRKGEIWVGHGR